MKTKTNGFSIDGKMMGSAFLCLLLLGITMPAWAAPEPDLNRNSAGAQMNRDREMLERERLLRDLQEEKEQRKAEIENKGQNADNDAPEGIAFTLKAVQVDDSAVLDKSDIEKITSAYIGQNVDIKKLFEIAAQINAVYEEKGYATCKAYIPPQRIHDGSVRIKLFEGRVGDVVVEGNKSTATNYIKNRLALQQGEVANMHALSDKLMLFNSTNDAQLRVEIEAGDERGTTDYTIKVREPQQFRVTTLVDNAGNYNTGEWREGIFWNDRSLTGRRDSFSIGYLRNKGTDSFNSSYSLPVGRHGTRLNFGYSTNSVELQRGDWQGYMRGHAYSMTMGVKQPLLVTESTRQDVKLEVGRQKSVTTLAKMLNMTDDTLHDLNLSFSQTDFGSSHIFYQEHGFNFGKIKHASDEKDSYKLYKLYAIYQKGYQHGQELDVRLDLQKSFTYHLGSQRQFYIGGTYSVRGYKENILYGDSGLVASAEYSVPIGANTDAFIFTDYGTVTGGVQLPNSCLWSAGFGVRSNLTPNISASLVLGMPILKDIDENYNDGKKVKSGRVHFILNGSF